MFRLLMPAVNSVAHYAAQEAVVEHADKLLPLLAALTAYQASADTRRGALETLTSLAIELPRHIRCLLASAHAGWSLAPWRSLSWLPLVEEGPCVTTRQWAQVAVQQKIAGQAWVLLGVVHTSCPMAWDLLHVKGSHATCCRGAHKAAVLAAARAAQDDRKRAVRAAAVRCHAAWAPV